MCLYHRYTSALFSPDEFAGLCHRHATHHHTKTFHVADGSEAPITMTAQETSALLRLEQNAPKTLFPFTSSFTAGEETHLLPQQKSLSAPPFFVIGDDEDSIAWLIANQDFLKNIHASGMITNVATQERVDAISQQTGWSPLTPVSMEGAESLLQTTHFAILCVRRSGEPMKTR